MAGEWPTSTLGDVADDVTLDRRATVEGQCARTIRVPVCSRLATSSSRDGSTARRTSTDQSTTASGLRQVDARAGRRLCYSTGNHGDSSAMSPIGARAVVEPRRRLVLLGRSSSTRRFARLSVLTTRSRQRVPARSVRRGRPTSPNVSLSDHARAADHAPAARRATRHRPHPRHAGRQDRAEPADERDAGGDGAGALQVVVRGLRPRPRQGRRPRPRPAQAPRRPLPGFLRGLGVGGDSEGVGGGDARRCSRASPPWSTARDDRLRVRLTSRWSTCRDAPSHSPTGAPPTACESNKFEFKKGEILFGKLRPYFHKVGVAPVDGVCSTDIVVVAPRDRSWFGFVLGHVSSDEFVEYTNAGSTGTKMPRTSWGEMARIPVVLPPKPVAEAFTAQVRPSIDRMIAAIHESRTLAALRDALLPKLISGELRVKDAERLLTAASP